MGKSIRVSALIVGILVSVAAWTAPAKAELLVGSYYTDQILGYDDKTGDFLGSFGSLLPDDFPADMTFGPDGNLYVGVNFTPAILRLNGQTGAFIDTFVSAKTVSGIIQDLVFGPDGNLYVGDFGSSANSQVIRYNGTTGAYIDDFIPAGSGGLRGLEGMVFGPDGNLYVTSRLTNQVLRYDGKTGGFLGVFADVVGANNGPVDLVFGPDKNLYVLDLSTGNVFRFNGTTGAFIDVFVTGASVDDRGSVDDASKLVFGPDGNLYVTTADVGSSVERFNGSTGLFLGDFVSPGSGGLTYATGLLFTPSQTVPEPNSTIPLSIIGIYGILSYTWRHRKGLLRGSAGIPAKYDTL